MLEKRPVVTVFGSCRQDSLSQFFRVTPIRDGLTYPHDTKEIIQAIEYCRSTKGEHPPAILFRNEQLGKPLIPRWLARVLFRRSDLVFVEVSSSLSYQWRQFSAHHELVDSSFSSLSNLPESARGDYEGHVTQTRQSDAEILADLKKIAQLIGKDRLVLVSHFSTRRSRHRENLTKLLARFAVANDIAVINPSALLDNWEERELFVSEPVLSHYTDSGHEIIAGRYRDVAFSLLSSRPPLIQVLDNTPEKVARWSSQGLGDVILGSGFLFQEARRTNREGFVDWTDYSLSEFFSPGDRAIHPFGGVRTPVFGGMGETSEEVRYLFHGTKSKEFSRSRRVFTNMRPNLPMDNQTRDFLFRAGFLPSTEVQKDIEDFFEKYSLKSNGFTALHLRFGDELAFSSGSVPSGSDAKLAKILHFTESVIAKTDPREPLALFTDSPQHIAHLVTKNHVLVSTKNTHSGLADSNFRSSTVMEFFLLGKARRIINLSSYPWGSGFSLAASQLFAKPYSQIDIHKPQELS